MIIEKDVTNMYRLILCREPDSQEVVAKQMQNPSLQVLLWQFLQSDEFLGRYRSAIRRVFDV
jgi:hypothetical protein